jgi:hypothetical protein
MRTFFFSFTTSMVAGMLLVTPTVTKQLHEATLKQCATHDWPAHQAEAHLKFCADYIKQNG